MKKGGQSTKKLKAPKTSVKIKKASPRFEVGKTYKIKDKLFRQTRDDGRWEQGKIKKLKFERETPDFYVFRHLSGYRECFMKRTEKVDWEVVL